jgi:hypothetical protein
VSEALLHVTALRDAVRELLAQREVWLQVRQALAAQDALLADVSARKLQLERRLAALKARPLRQAPAPVALPPAGWVPPGLPEAPKTAPTPQPVRPPAPARVPDRAALSEWANRFQHVLAVDAGVLMRINQIVEDGERALGEAVALLPDRAFEPLPRESEQDHADRLGAWGEALQECRRRLGNEVRRAEADLRPSLGVRDLWLGRDLNEAGRAAWQEYLDGCRAEEAAAADRLEVEVRRLETGGSS